MSSGFLRFRRLVVVVLIVLTGRLSAAAAGENPGTDIGDIFAAARSGQPLRYVAIGGSITQAGKGWIGDWLRGRFPRSSVTAVNSGMSATGSGLGVFRIDQDVIAYQPDLVAIEFCVNDADSATSRPFDTWKAWLSGSSDCRIRRPSSSSKLPPKMDEPATASTRRSALWSA